MSNREAVDDKLHPMSMTFLKLDFLMQLVDLSVDADSGEPISASAAQQRFISLVAHRLEWCEKEYAITVERNEDALDHLLSRLRTDRYGTARAVLHADGREEGANVVEYLRHRTDGGTGVATRCLLLDGDGRRQTGNALDFWLLHLIEELASVRR